MSDTLFALTIFALASSITPGPNNLMLMASGTNFGFRRTLPHLMGVSIGFVAMIVLVGVGLAQLFAAYPLAHQVLRIVSIAYLLWLAWRIATAPPPAAREGKEAKPLSFVQAALFQWVNPKAWTMALTALSAYMPPTDPRIGLLIVAGVFGLVNLPSVGLWTLLGVQMRRFLGNAGRLRAFNLTMAGLLVASLYPTVVSP
ncbi:LysE family translocator [Sphingomonas sp. G-3-2-10]|uniref:LysE family translocator n=1 Tax=Sphingomonas sp. G-3-2-10 TaxID=2728838 RepID=UPI00146C5A23|nr:LysE family translocator [Sphingomonas sp. G-3-2-10]NML05376.1 LysE family translocator [Sphingomonas sp. G-3-2-10]